MIRRGDRHDGLQGPPPHPKAGEHRHFRKWSRSARNPHSARTNPPRSPRRWARPRAKPPQRFIQHTGIQIAGVRVTVDENRYSSGIYDGVCRRGERHRRHDHHYSPARHRARAARDATRRCQSSARPPNAERIEWLAPLRTRRPSARAARPIRNGVRRRHSSSSRAPTSGADRQTRLITASTPLTGNFVSSRSMTSVGIRPADGRDSHNARLGRHPAAELNHVR